MTNFFDQHWFGLLMGAIAFVVLMLFYGGAPDGAGIVVSVLTAGFVAAACDETPMV